MSIALAILQRGVEAGFGVALVLLLVFIVILAILLALIAVLLVILLVRVGRRGRDRPDAREEPPGAKTSGSGTAKKRGDSAYSGTTRWYET